ncbi:Fur-regulated basic protein FbpA [Pseudalkalibacillus caeni]|uniref:Fur-regulated basic protein FbpA n=1 Tax=Exobacillus caeni TaxID=2574798 RepID=A0A5R9F2D0_9BACL|nr:Fur-regulated basic protein FbpA [Pseudalkalibacillus caeni]TLS37767.1 Fur-regulated basic protein FbpA [Pseudalkalibacillus caeni]
MGTLANSVEVKRKRYIDFLSNLGYTKLKDGRTLYDLTLSDLEYFYNQERMKEND